MESWPSWWTSAPPAGLESNDIIACCTKGSVRHWSINADRKNTHLEFLTPILVAATLWLLAMSAGLILTQRRTGYWKTEKNRKTKKTERKEAEKQTVNACSLNPTASIYFLLVHLDSVIGLSGCYWFFLQIMTFSHLFRRKFCHIISFMGRNLDPNNSIVTCIHTNLRRGQ